NSRWSTEYRLVALNLVNEARGQRKAMKRDGFGFLLGVPDADDFLAVDQHPAIFVPLGQESSHLAPVEVPLTGIRALRVAAGQFCVRYGRPFNRRQGHAAGLLDGLAMRLLDHGPMVLLLFPLALHGLADQGLDQFASILLRLAVTCDHLVE